MIPSIQQTGLNCGGVSQLPQSLAGLGNIETLPCIPIDITAMVLVGIGNALFAKYFALPNIVESVYIAYMLPICIMEHNTTQRMQKDLDERKSSVKPNIDIEDERHKKVMPELDEKHAREMQEIYENHRRKMARYL